MIFVLFTIAMATTPMELLHQAQERAYQGDYNETRALATAAKEIPGDHQRKAEMFIALSYEFGGEPQRALEIYNSLLKGSSSNDVALFIRRAETYGRLGDYRHARRALRRAYPIRALNTTAAARVKVSRGIADLKLGRLKRGVKRLFEELDDKDTPVYDRARAYHALIEHTVATSETISLANNALTPLENRAQLIAAARRWTLELLVLEQPLYSVDSLYWLGRAYESLGDQVRKDQITDHEKRSRNVYLQAIGIYERGLRVAITFGWLGPEVERIEEAITQTQKKMAELNATPVAKPTSNPRRL